VTGRPALPAAPSGLPDPAGRYGCPAPSAPPAASSPRAR